LIRAKTLLVLAAALVVSGRASAVTITRGPIIENPDALTSTMTIAWWTDAAGDSTVEYSPTPAPLSVAFVMDSPAARTGQCGEAGFPGAPGPACTFNGPGSAVTCK